MKPRVLVAGIGNVFFRDDGFGVEVVKRLVERVQPPGVKIADYGIRGMHLAYEIVSGYEAVIFIDALPPRGDPGAVRTIVPNAHAEGRCPDAHTMDLENVFAFVRVLGGSNASFFLVGCEAADVSDGMGLSAEVAAAVPAAAAEVASLVRRFAYSEASA